ncbi:sensor histidine kinase [Oscillospiraceae bacterium LTW-04]|nr:sensor histidine kinase [Oscillospiraceae bacterium MB24-C1]
MQSQLALIQQLHGNSPIPFAVADHNLLIVWVNACALKHYPALSVPGGLSLLVSSAQLEVIKKTPSGEPRAFSVPLTAMEHFAASFTPIEDGYLISFGFADSQDTPMLPQSIDYLTSAISGRLRAPLANIFAGISTIARMPDVQQNEQLCELTQQINLNSYHMLRFTIDFTAHLHFLLGNEPFSPALLDLSDLLRRLGLAAGVLTDSIGIGLSLDIPEIPVYIMSDDRLLNHAILHIISNCCRFTKPDNAISLALSADDSCAHITIRDRGQGIPQNLLDKVCEPFFSYDHEGLPMSGSGLGLSVARQIIVLHNGTLAIASKEDEGTTVAISLPLAPQDDDTLVLKSPPPVADMLRDRFSLLHIILSDSCNAPRP